ncbi:MAG: RNA ligase family protein [Candidatus Micrarchaeota archaeon]
MTLATVTDSRFPNAPKRFPIGEKRPGRPESYLNSAEVVFLLSRRVLIEEKMDGKPILLTGDRFVLVSEDLKNVHSIRYRIPGRYAVFDVLDLQRNLFLDNDGKREVIRDAKSGILTLNETKGINIFQVPLLTKGTFEIQDLPKLIGLSAYAIDVTGQKTFMEGIVVKQDREHFQVEYLSGKLVRTEFTEGILVHHTRMRSRTNIIDPSTSEPSCPLLAK